ncbi:MAG: hypothetical protein K0R18_584 [Bacillales bacterium]|nr:hypothetical protein [Bacillales bacterium]
MALVTLLEYLKHNEIKHNIVDDHLILNDVTIDFFEINNENCWVITNQHHEVKFDITSFKQMSFDALPWGAKNSIEMHRCLRDLESSKPYNAYFEDAKGIIIFGFYGIGKK